MVVAVAVLCSPVRAQMGGMGGMGDMTQFMSPVTKKAVTTWAQMLKMDADQKEAALALQEGYRSSFKAMTEETQKTFREMMERARESMDWQAFQKEAATVGKEMTEKMERLEKGFMNDVKSLLNEKQLEQWPRVERARKRDNGLRFGFMAGQNMDLVKMLEAAKVDVEASPELKEQVLRYELDMDREIAAFEKWGKEQQAKQAEAADMFDMNRIQDMLKEMTDVSKRMRDVNRQHAKSIAALLPAEKQGAFDLEVKRKSYPRVYREVYVQRAMSQALGFADLTPDQKEAITSLRDGYAREAEGLNRTWASAIDEKEEKEGGAIGSMMSGFMGGGNEKDPVADARKARRELDTRTKDKLLALLKEDQKTRLPEDKPDPRENRMMDFGFDLDPPDKDED